MIQPLPDAFRARMQAQLGPDADAYFAAMNEPYQRGLRFNPLKTLSPAALADVSGVEEPVPWCASLGRYLALNSAAGADPLHEAGAYYLQEPSAMAPVGALAPEPGERVLDLCAAPGGKSTQIAAALDGRGLLVANEPVFSRAKILSRNIERMGITNALVVSALPERLVFRWRHMFNAVLVDAPCSGEGMFRRHPETRGEWSEPSPAGCAARQKHILSCAVAMLKPGGRLVYSTCTLNREENEHVVDWLLREYPLLRARPFSLPGGEGRTLDAPQGMLRLYPHEIRGEGHFIACVELNDGPLNGGPSPLFMPAASRLSPPQKGLLAAYAAFQNDFRRADEGPPAANAQLGDALICAPELPPLDGVKILRAGIWLGALKGKAFAPDHAMAMAPAASRGFPALALDRSAALRYLRGETLPAPDALKGWTLVTYEGLALGFGKAGGGQLKNHYPKGLRRP